MRNKHSRTNESRLLKTFSRVQTPVILSVCFASCTSRTAHSSLHICLQLVARQFQRALIHSPFLSFFFQSCSGCTIQTETAFLTQPWVETRETSIFPVSVSFLFLSLSLRFFLAFTSITTDDNRAFSTRRERMEKPYSNWNYFVQALKRSILYLYFLLNERFGRSSTSRRYWKLIGRYVSTIKRRSLSTNRNRSVRKRLV